jgi:protein-S-isoprenylcysteine O-methyltransferase Ste14
VRTLSDPLRLPALIPAAMGTLLLVVRTYLEDRTLKEELTGYLEYPKETRYGLIPRVW